MTREQAVLVTLIVYKVVLIAIGLLAERRTRDGADYLLAGRKMGPVVAAVSASASSSSAWTLLGVSGMAYASGLSSLWLFPACVGGFALNWYVLAPAMRRVSHREGQLTATEMLAGPQARPLRSLINGFASLIVLVSLMAYVASQFDAAGQSFEETFRAWGVSRTSSVVLGSAIVVFYTMLGGFWAVSLTDTLQGLLMALTALVLPIAALFHLGFGGLVEGLRAVDQTGYMSVFGNMALPAGVGFAAGLLGIGLGYPGQPHVVNRFMALREGDRAMRSARRVAMTWAVCVYTGMIVLGLCARVLFPELGEANKEKAFIAIANELFHPIVAGVMVAAVLSAVMSTADSQLLVAGSTVTHDLGLGGKGSQKSVLLRSRIVVVLLSVVAVALVLSDASSIFERVLFAWSAMGCAFGPLLLVTVLRGRVAPRSTLIAMLLGFSLSVASYYAKGSAWWADAGLKPWSGVFERVLPFALALLVAWRGAQTKPPLTRHE